MLVVRYEGHPFPFVASFSLFSFLLPSPNSVHVKSRDGVFDSRANSCLRPFVDRLIITLFTASATFQSFFFDLYIIP
jgi:hypothetical protein